MRIRAIRGATTVETDERDCVLSAVTQLLTEILNQNNLTADDLISVIFTATHDIKSAYPAEAARGIGIVYAGLMCQQEMYVAGSLDKCIRVLIHAETDIPQRDVKHIYLKGASVLRPDITNERFAIAIDGPAGAGKSTVAKVLAGELGFIYVDTGAIYRAAALYKTLNPSGGFDDMRISLKAGQRVYLNNKDVTRRIREPDITSAASVIATDDNIRRIATDMARNISTENNVVMDGRDIATVVLPGAQIKIYLDASVKTRAKRRAGELKAKGINADINEIEQEIKDRDYRDMNRSLAPLVRHPGAVYIDTSDMTIKEAVQKIREIAGF